MVTVAARGSKEEQQLRFMRDDQEAGNDGEEGIIKKKKMIISLHYLVEVV
ncbi:hypothetical protein DAI22_05g065600 [Oryza sativa Japonica Group]|nr:hypothetical protein DAI22_05g065600 [Oryza sativa Japonica Group]